MKAAPSSIMSRFAPRSIRLSVALALMGMLILVGYGNASGNVRSGETSTYSCNNPHCYGSNEWPGGPRYFGAYTDILVVPLQCTSDCATDGLGMIDNEIWLTDSNDAQCKSKTPTLECWVEAGYMMHHDSPDEIFFWYDKRPGFGPAWEIANPVGPAPPPVSASPTIFIAAPRATSSPPATPTLPPGDYGQKDHFMIIDAGNGSFQIFMYDDTMSQPFGGISSPNPLIGARQIKIGQELHGTGGAAAGQATFTRNLYAVQPLGQDNRFWYDVQRQQGSIIANGPPVWKWDIDPATSADGGTFSTQCC